MVHLLFTLKICLNTRSSTNDGLFFVFNAQHIVSFSLLPAVYMSPCFRVSNRLSCKKTSRLTQTYKYAHNMNGRDIDRCILFHTLTTIRKRYPLCLQQSQESVQIIKQTHSWNWPRASYKKGILFAVGKEVNFSILPFFSFTIFV